MQNINTRQKRQLQNRLQTELWWYELDCSEDWYERMMELMYQDWLSEQRLAVGETVCEVQQEGDLVLLLHHGNDYLEAANSLTANQWFGLDGPER